jgi:hypothetical protein
MNRAAAVVLAFENGKISLIRAGQAMGLFCYAWPLLKRSDPLIEKRKRKRVNLIAALGGSVHCALPSSSWWSSCPS